MKKKDSISSIYLQTLFNVYLFIFLFLRRGAFFFSQRENERKDGVRLFPGRNVERDLCTVFQV